MSALAKAKAAAEAAGSGSLSSGEAALRSGPPSRPMSIEHAVASPQQRDAPVLALPLSAPYRVQITNLETKAVTLINDFLKGDDSFEHFAFNDDRLYAASENTIKIASVKLHHRDGKRILRKVREADVSEIVMVANEADYRKHTNGEKASMHRIHGLATPMGGLAKIE